MTTTLRKPPQMPFSLLCKPEFIAAAATAEGEEKKLPRVKMVAYRGGPMRLAGWGPTPVIISLAGLVIPASVPLRFNHDGYELVGHSDSIKVEGTNLLLEGVISFETPRTRAIVTAAANGFPWQASVGVAPDFTAVKFVEAGQTADVNGKTWKGPLYVVNKGWLREVSVLDLGADSGSKTQIAAMATETSMDETVDTAGAGSGGGANSGGAGAAVQTPPVRAGETIDSIVGEAQAKQDRKDRITAMVRASCATPGVTREMLDAFQRIGTEAINANWDDAQVELALIRAGRAAPSIGAPSIGSGNGAPTDAVLAAALLMSCGVSHEKLVKDPDFGERTVQAAWTRSRGRMSLHQLIATALQASGAHVGHGGTQIFDALLANAPLLAMQRARGFGDIRAGFSTVSLAGILGTVGNKLLQDSFTDVESTYQEICQLADFSNFLTYTSYRLTASGGFQKIGPTGELKHANLGEQSATNRLETSGMMLTLDRQQIINDDLNAFAQLFKIMGRDSLIALEEATYDAFMESSDVIFTSARGNRNTSAALSLANLQIADAALMAQVNENGKPIYAMGSKLIVPPALKALADSIFVSEHIVSGNSTNQPQANTLRGRFKPVCSPFLSHTALAGASATTWYLACDPKKVPFLQAAFLQGKRQPTVETADAAFNTLGIQMRGFFDFGLAVNDYRGANKNTA